MNRSVSAGETVHDIPRTFGYLCPYCGKTVQGTRDTFTLLSGDINLSCSCGHSTLHTMFDGTRFHLNVPCGLCGQTHTAVCPRDQLLKADSAFSCPESGNFCCFSGQAGTVEKHLPELELSASRTADNTFENNPILYEILAELRDIAARPDGIICRCGSRQYGMRIRHSAVELICRDCGGRLRIPAASADDLDDLCCHMSLTIPGRTPGAS